MATSHRRLAKPAALGTDCRTGCRVCVRLELFDGFSSLSSIRAILVLASLIGLSAVGQTLVVLLGAFDMSVPGFIVAGAITVTELTARYHLSFGLAVLLLVIGAGTLGALMGWVCHRYHVHPLLVTLAMSSVAIGTVQVQVPSGLLEGSAPSWLSNLTAPIAQTFGVGIPPIVVIWLAVAILFAVFAIAP